MSRRFNENTPRGEFSSNNQQVRRLHQNNSGSSRSSSITTTSERAGGVDRSGNSRNSSSINNTPREIIPLALRNEANNRNLNRLADIYIAVVEGFGLRQQQQKRIKNCKFLNDDFGVYASKVIFL